MRIVLIATLLLLAGCDKDKPVDHDARLLFTHDGCKVYRFIDLGVTNYFTQCESAMDSGAMYKAGDVERIIRTTKNSPTPALDTRD